MNASDLDRWHMAHALKLAVRGRGFVEPNPMVGCVIARGAEIVGVGWHRRFGGPHAEIEALRLAGAAAGDATLYATLEPCCHQGKTPPCTEAIIAAGVARVVVAAGDPFHEVDGRGIDSLRARGITVDTGVLTAEARDANAPYFKRIETGRPWLIAKWAMTLDGKIATRSGDSQWISGEASRRVAHALRGRVDAIVVGRGTAVIDDPALTARPPGPRTAMRVVVDSHAALPIDRQLVRTAKDVPVLVAVAECASDDARNRLAAAGCEVLTCPGDTYAARFDHLLAEFGRRGMTNVLVEGGGTLLGQLLDDRLIDEIHAFIAPKLVGGAGAPGPMQGGGIERIAAAMRVNDLAVQTLGEDIYLSGRVDRAAHDA